MHVCDTGNRDGWGTATSCLGGVVQGHTGVSGGRTMATREWTNLEQGLETCKTGRTEGDQWVKHTLFHLWWSLDTITT